MRISDWSSDVCSSDLRPRIQVIGHLAMAYALGVVASIGYGVIKSGERPGARFIGMTEHHNVLGITGLIGLALIPFIWSRTDAKWPWFWLGVAAVHAAAVWFSGPRCARNSGGSGRRGEVRGV